MDKRKIEKWRKEPANTLANSHRDATYTPS
jgi:hypothetical protein